MSDIDPELEAKLDKLSDRQVAVMDAIFDFAKAMEMDDAAMTTNDLVEVMNLAIRDGHEMLLLNLTMLTVALKVLMKERGIKSKLL